MFNGPEVICHVSASNKQETNYHPSGAHIQISGSGTILIYSALL